MAKTIKKNISTTVKAWKIAETKSKELFGKKNVSGYITYLILNSEKK